LTQSISCEIMVTSKGDSMTVYMTQKEIDDNEQELAFNAENEDGLYVLMGGEWLKVEVIEE